MSGFLKSSGGLVTHSMLFSQSLEKLKAKGLLPRQFDVGLLAPDGTELVLSYSIEQSVVEFLSRNLLQLSNHFEPEVITYGLVSEEADEVLKTKDYLISSRYVRGCLKEKRMPRFKGTRQAMYDSLQYKRQSELKVCGVLGAEGGASRQREAFAVRFAVQGREVVVEKVLREHSILKVKCEAAAAANTEAFNAGTLQKYILKVPGAQFITDESGEVGSLPYVRNCLIRSRVPVFAVLDKTSKEVRGIKKNNLEIGSLLGRPISWLQQDGEVTSFCQSMALFRYEHYAQRARASGGEVASRSGLTVHTGEFIAPENGAKTLINLSLELLQMRKTIAADEKDTADEIIERCVQRYYINTGKTVRGAGEFLLKASGLAEYIYGSTLFHCFDYVRECIVKKRASRNEEEAFETEHQLSLIEDPKTDYCHEEVSVMRRELGELRCMSVWDVEREFRFRVIGVENISHTSNEFVLAYGSLGGASSRALGSLDEVPAYLYVTAELCHGEEVIDVPWRSGVVPASANPRWYEWAEFSIRVRDLPRAVKVCVTLWVSKRAQPSGVDVPLAWVNWLLFNYSHELETGMKTYNMWLGGRANPIGACVENGEANPMMLYVELEEYQLPVVFPSSYEGGEGAGGERPVMRPWEESRLNRVVESDPLSKLSMEDKHMLWKYREHCKKMPRALPKFLASVPMYDGGCVREMHRLLGEWARMEPIDALALLDAKYGDVRVREYGVSRLMELVNEELFDYMLQLVQVVSYEPYHDTVLARMLLRLALDNQFIGFHFFWYLKSQLHVRETFVKYCLLLEVYLQGIESSRVLLSRQSEMVQRLVGISNAIKTLKDSERLGLLREELSKISFPPEGVCIPLNPRVIVKGFCIEKCRYMDSKKLPLWLVYTNGDVKGEEQHVIFKSGDDLRQDMLILQMIRIMDQLWKKAGYDFKMNPYRCIATGNGVGMIEVVLNSTTTASITRTAGGATAAFREDPIANWIREYNPTEAGYRAAVENFILSCAGYCVATYVLGIGDRHNDNIMITKDGKLFHIDYGHFLGNFKKKFGVKRERAPFVFTPDFAYVMGGKDGKNFARFLELCQRAYNLLRRHSGIFINMFSMMVSTGIPELQTTEDIQYLRDAFSLDLSDEQAAAKFTQLIYESMHTRTTRINNAIHILAH
ncbi:phosphatidylinositol 3-kinase 1-like [Schistocerca gregaria]|uniref:phosphatidylinositol 3-kinase 1-like n=1 Tax=Schistocerca gregaria TaxID=7010 RepID=UPI00211E406D|nr:phosphatidylinositol 3-kinase 1-like [Schistocerca gregaria]